MRDRRHEARLRRSTRPATTAENAELFNSLYTPRDGTVRDDTLAARTERVQDLHPTGTALP